VQIGWQKHLTFVKPFARIPHTQQPRQEPQQTGEMNEMTQQTANITMNERFVLAVIDAMVESIAKEMGVTKQQALNAYMATYEQSKVKATTIEAIGLVADKLNWQF
jgi:hypothetical protein